MDNWTKAAVMRAALVEESDNLKARGEYALAQKLYDAAGLLTEESLVRLYDAMKEISP